MSDEEKSAGENGLATAAVNVSSEAPQPDEHTTEPNVPEPVAPAGRGTAPGQWQMPKPKFQQTSGYLPQGYLDGIKQAAASRNAAAGSENTTQEQVPFTPSPPQPDGPAGAVPDVEPQPDLTDQLMPDEPAAVTGANELPVKKGPSIQMIVVGLLGMVAILATVVLTVYFVFLAKSTSVN